jgi:hypothetical protein
MPSQMHSRCIDPAAQNSTEQMSAAFTDLPTELP